MHFTFNQNKAGLLSTNGLTHMFSYIYGEYNSQYFTCDPNQEI